MNIKRTVLSLLLAATLMAGACAPKVNTNPGQPKGITADDVLRGAKRVGSVAAISLNEGIALENTLAANGTIDKALEPQIRQWLKDGQTAVNSFNDRIAKYDHLDADSRKVIADFLSEAVSFIDNLNNNGILRIKNPNSQLIAAGIIAGARVAITIYKQTVFDKIP